MKTRVVFSGQIDSSPNSIRADVHEDATVLVSTAESIFPCEPTTDERADALAAAVREMSREMIKIATFVRLHVDEAVIPMDVAEILGAYEPRLRPTCEQGT